MPQPFDSIDTHYNRTFPGRVPVIHLFLRQLDWKRAPQGGSLPQRLWTWSGHGVSGVLWPVNSYSFLKGQRKNNFALSGWFFWPRASLFAPYRPAGGVGTSLTPPQRPKLPRRKI